MVPRALSPCMMDVSRSLVTIGRASYRLMESLTHALDYGEGSLLLSPVSLDIFRLKYKRVIRHVAIFGAKQIKSRIIVNANRFVDSSINMPTLGSLGSHWLYFYMVPSFSITSRVAEMCKLVDYKSACPITIPSLFRHSAPIVMVPLFFKQVYSRRPHLWWAAKRCCHRCGLGCLQPQIFHLNSDGNIKGRMRHGEPSAPKQKTFYKLK